MFLYLKLMRINRIGEKHPNSIGSEVCPRYERSSVTRGQKKRRKKSERKRKGRERRGGITKKTVKSVARHIRNHQ